MQTYVIEHLEPRVWKWCFIEYKEISKIVGKKNLWFTNIKNKNPKLEKLGKCFKERFFQIAEDKDISPNRICILDPEAKQTLTPKSSKKFNYFIFGGILGDYPPRKRTKKELSIFTKGKKCNIGKKQFSTDNAVYVTHEIAKGKAFKKIKFIYKPTIQINKILSVNLPYLYPEINSKPRMSPELLAWIKKKKGF